ncbi:kinase-like domain-containing protein [Rhizophagus clarus]|uniref:Kinase-like domain-containing protein n=1 Tax=Rhizophagus clarus TaxID=94130 RepID=A0A8H3LEH0_9GLOM|nr:kinase-like domain-containing protein [Rhizophagus clarus]
MKLININNKNSYDPTPRLKSSPVPAFFIPLMNNEKKCNRCENEYSETLMFKQKYCKICFLEYIECTMDNNIYLDVCINTNKIKCIKHETRSTYFCTNNIQEWCEHCSEVLYFRQIVPNDLLFNPNNRKIFCNLCGKLIKQTNSILDYICSDCYLVSYEQAESTLITKPSQDILNISIIHLPWWDSYDKCKVCSQELKYLTDNQKWCLYCCIAYNGCRYCLTTNIIFTIADQSQCRKCKRISFITIDITNITSEITNIFFTCLNNASKIISKASNIYEFIRNERTKWVPFSHIKNLEKIAKGGFGTVYKATLHNEIIAVKRFFNSQNTSKYFLNELKSLYYTAHTCHTLFPHIINCRGITQDPVTKDYMIIMTYADGGNLHDYMQKNFINITWRNKIEILENISRGLLSIHIINFVHRDIHSGNILLLNMEWHIADLGLSQPANDTLLNDEIYGVIPYIAPEIFKESKKLGPEFNQKSHSKAILTSKAMISKFSTINSFTMLHSMKQEYITKELDFDIETKRLFLSNIQESQESPLNNQHPNAIYTSRSLSKLISTVNSSKKSNIEVSKIETQNSGKHVKINHLDL